MKIETNCLIVIMVVVIFTIFAGCIGSEIKNTPSSDEATSSLKTSQKTDVNNPDIILRLSDLPAGFNLDNYGNLASPKSAFCTIRTMGSGTCTRINYKENIPIGNRFMGSSIAYSDKNGRRIGVNYQIYDANDGLQEALDGMKKSVESSDTAKKGLVKTGQPNIGEYSLWVAGSDTNNPDLIYSRILFIYKDTNVEISVLEEKDKSLIEAISIAKIVESRINDINIEKVSRPITPSISMEFVSIPAGEFNMGSPSNEAGRYDSEGPVHHVIISNAFYMGKYEVTQKQWLNVMGNNPSDLKGDNLPVEQVSWNDVQDFIKKLNEKEGGDKYRLPSEAEWEYAARAGTTTRYSFGDDESKLGDYAWYSDSIHKPHDVGQKKPNPWGLYDMHGNVWEWVQDNWHDNYNGAPTDGSSWEGSGSDRVARGGHWGGGDGGVRSADRDSFDPGFRIASIGFRLLRVS